MLTNIYNTAKRILSRSPSVQGRSSELRETPPSTHHLEVSMVTTRRGTETPGQDSSATPRSSGKKRVLKREIEALETPTATKRQKRSTPKKAAAEEVPEPAVAAEEPITESADDTSDTIALAVPRSQTPTQADKLPIRRRSSPQVIVDKLSPPVTRGSQDTEEAIAEDDAPTPTQETEVHTPDQKSDAVYATPASHAKAPGSPTPRAKRASERISSAKKSSPRKKYLHSEVEEIVESTPAASNLADEIPSSTYESEQAPLPSKDAIDALSQPAKAHVRFGSEDPEEMQESVTMNLQGHRRYGAPTTTQAPEPEVADSDDEASDSDEAPEVVTTSVATSKAAASQQDATRAQLAQQEKERKKREARDQRIAAEQAEKRKRDEKKAKKLAKQLAKQQEQESDEEEPSTAPLTNSIDLAGLLPTSLLSNIPDRRAPTPPSTRPGKTDEELRREKLNHHIKFLERTEKGIKDVKKGKLSVAVLGQQNRVLPPKVNRDTRNVREMWLKGRQVDARKGKKGIGGKMERKGYGQKGFLRGDD